MSFHILLIENNSLESQASLQPCLTEEGYQVNKVHTPQEVAAGLQVDWPDAVVYFSFPGAPGLDTFRQPMDTIGLQLPWLVVDPDGAQPLPNDRLVTGLTTTDPEKIAKTLQTILKRQKQRFIRLPGLILDCRDHLLLRDGQPFSLTPKEFKLLHLLIQNADQVTSRREIMRQVWDTDYLGDTRTLDVHIRWLRKKLEENPSRPRRLITVRGVGYHFVSHPDE
ncbi:MAG: DNA-binding response regulator [Chloroflexi bacterium]|nr:MAG: DNA-binding response regulator [Chloroflexota bacterium]